MSLLDSLVLPFVDFLHSLKPTKIDPDLMSKVKIVAHRGDHSNHKENTLAAFDSCLNKNIYGIEFDVRWTKDLVPVVFHDEHAGRVFNRPDIYPHKLHWVDLNKEIPEIPTLKQIIERYGKKLHLFIEIKSPMAGLMNLENMKHSLKQHLFNLTPVDDYYILSLEKDNFQLVDFVNPKAYCLVATTDFNKKLNEATENKFSHLLGYYGFYNKCARHTLNKHGIQWGCGYISSKKIIQQQFNSGAKWIFTNKIIKD